MQSFHEDFDRRMTTLTTLIEGPPWERSIRGRLHVLEGEGMSAKAAAHALAEAQRERRETREERDQHEARRRGEWWKGVAALSALVAVLAPYVERIFT